MGAEIFIRKKDVDLIYFCKSSAIFRAFDICGYLNTDKPKFQLTEEHLRRVKEMLKARLDDEKVRLKYYERILEGLNTFKDRTECLDEIEEINETIDEIEYGIHAIEFLTDVWNMDRMAIPMEVIYSY